MKKILLAGLLLTALHSHPLRMTVPQQKVYVCVSSSAYAYHQDKSCSGLNRCTHTIKYVTEDDALNVYKRKRCKICY